MPKGTGQPTLSTMFRSQSCTEPMDIATPLNKDVHSDNNEQSSIHIVVDNSDVTVGNNSNVVVGDDSGDGSGDAAVGDGNGDDSGDAAVNDDVTVSGCRSGVDTYKMKMERKRGLYSQKYRSE